MVDLIMELVFALRSGTSFPERRFAPWAMRLVAAASLTVLLPASGIAQQQMHLGQRCTARDYFRVETPDTALPRVPLLGVRRVYIAVHSVTAISTTTLDAYTLQAEAAFRSAGFEISTTLDEDLPGTATVDINVDTPSKTNRSVTIFILDDLEAVLEARRVGDLHARVPKRLLAHTSKACSDTVPPARL